MEVEITRLNDTGEGIALINGKTTFIPKTIIGDIVDVKIIKEYKNIENQEKNIDKRTGAIYSELMPDGTKRDICGYCWEKERIKIPVSVDIKYDEYLHPYYDGYCYSCKTHCYENIEPEIPSNISNNAYEGELPF